MNTSRAWMACNAAALAIAVCAGTPAYAAVPTSTETAEAPTLSGPARMSVEFAFFRTDRAQILPAQQTAAQALVAICYEQSHVDSSHNPPKIFTGRPFKLSPKILQVISGKVQSARNFYDQISDVQMCLDKGLHSPRQADLQGVRYAAIITHYATGTVPPEADVEVWVTSVNERPPDANSQTTTAATGQAPRPTPPLPQSGFGETYRFSVGENGNLSKEQALLTSSISSACSWETKLALMSKYGVSISDSMAPLIYERDEDIGACIDNRLTETYSGVDLSGVIYKLSIAHF